MGPNYTMKNKREKESKSINHLMKKMKQSQKDL